MTKEELILWHNYVLYKDGRIWSKYYKKYLKGRLVKGYVRVSLKCIDGKQRDFYWHRVIWFVFNGEIPVGYEVNHIDENKQNNALSNLNLMTHLENINFGTRNERTAKKMRGKKQSKEAIEKRVLKTSKQVVAVDEDNNVVMEFPSTAEAGRQGFNQGHISACCNNCYGKLGNYHKGLRWYFKKDWKQIQIENAAPRKRETAYQLEINFD